MRLGDSAESPDNDRVLSGQTVLALGFGVTPAPVRFVVTGEDEYGAAVGHYYDERNGRRYSTGPRGLLRYYDHDAETWRNAGSIKYLTSPSGWHGWQTVPVEDLQSGMEVNFDSWNRLRDPAADAQTSGFPFHYSRVIDNINAGAYPFRFENGKFIFRPELQVYFPYYEGGGEWEEFGEFIGAASLAFGAASFFTGSSFSSLFDVASDVAFETASDVAFEAASDVAFEAAGDVAFEAAGDAAFEAASDVAFEAAGDAAFEAAGDAGFEAAFEAAGELAADGASMFDFFDEVVDFSEIVETVETPILGDAPLRFEDYVPSDIYDEYRVPVENAPMETVDVDFSDLTQAASEIGETVQLPSTPTVDDVVRETVKTASKAASSSSALKILDAAAKAMSKAASLTPASKTATVNALQTAQSRLADASRRVTATGAPASALSMIGSIPSWAWIGGAGLLAVVLLSKGRT